MSFSKSVSRMVHSHPILKYQSTYYIWLRVPQDTCFPVFDASVGQYIIMSLCYLLIYKNGVFNFQGCEDLNNKKPILQINAFIKIYR